MFSSPFFLYLKKISLLKLSYKMYIFDRIIVKSPYGWISLKMNSMIKEVFDKSMISVLELLYAILLAIKGVEEHTH